MKKKRKSEQSCYEDYSMSDGEYDANENESDSESD